MQQSLVSIVSWFQYCCFMSWNIKDKNLLQILYSVKNHQELMKHENKISTVPISRITGFFVKRSELIWYHTLLVLQINSRQITFYYYEQNSIGWRRVVLFWLLPSSRPYIKIYAGLWQTIGLWQECVKNFLLKKYRRVYSKSSKMKRFDLPFYLNWRLPCVSSCGQFVELFEKRRRRGHHTK